MFKLTVEKDTKGWEDIKKRLIKEQKELHIGWFQGNNYGPENDNLPVAQVAQWNEEGSITNPMRPFIRMGFMRHVEKGLYQSYFIDSIQRIADGTSTFTQEYTKLGPVFVKDMQEVIEDWNIPPNSPTTIAEKGFNDPLIHTGKMHDSVSFKITGKGGTN